MTDAVIFAGPTLSMPVAQKEFGLRAEDNVLVLENEKKISFLPPVAEGDIFRLIPQKPSIIGVIDGYFENVPTVWHKEILFAMTQGIHVFGASSMGALRAAELASFGMEGVGKIYHDFASQTLEDDDEVTVLHGPVELGFPPLSEAMVNIRCTMDAAYANKMLSKKEADMLVDIGKNLFYKERNYKRILEVASKQGFDKGHLFSLEKWLKTNAKDQKKSDAMDMLALIIQRLRAPINKKEVLYHFEETLIWRNARSGRSL